MREKVEKMRTEMVMTPMGGHVWKEIPPHILNRPDQHVS